MITYNNKVLCLKILQSVRQPGARTNPYIIQLVESVRAKNVDVEYFSWTRGIIGRYDILHLHWPEVMIRRDGRVQRWLAILRFLLLMVRLTADGRIALVRTLHNVRAHESGSHVERLLLRWCEWRVNRWIALNDETQTPDGTSPRVILHGDYRGWFDLDAVPKIIPGRLLFFGLIRPYKGVDSLLGAFKELPGESYTLRIVGKPADDEIAREIMDAVRRDRRVSALLDYADDVTLAAEVGAAELVVLPYREMHNSGALLLALSLGRPVLVPEAPVNLTLATEVGTHWVRTYPSTLTVANLKSALAVPQGEAVPKIPDLDRRSWQTIAEQHISLYREVIGPPRSSTRMSQRSTPQQDPQRWYRFK